MIASEDMHVLIPGTVNILPYIARGLYRDMINMNLELEGYPGLLGWATANHIYKLKRKAEEKA